MLKLKGIKWNKKGEIDYKDRIIRKSNIVKIVKYYINIQLCIKRPSMTKKPKGYDYFRKMMKSKMITIPEIGVVRKKYTPPGKVK